MFVESGGDTNIGATTYSSRGWIAGSTNLLFSAIDAGSSLDLSSIDSWDGSYTHTTSGAISQLVLADGGSIDLSGLATIVSPTNPEDRLDFTTRNGGSILLTALTSVSGAGRTRFDIEAGTSLVDL